MYTGLVTPVLVRLLLQTQGEAYDSSTLCLRYIACARPRASIGKEGLEGKSSNVLPYHQQLTSGFQCGHVPTRPDRPVNNLGFLLMPSSI